MSNIKITESGNWLKELTDVELAYWEAKPQSDKDWWDANTKPENRLQILRTEREAYIKRLEAKADVSRIHLHRIFGKAPANRDLITISPEILDGTPVFNGTRVSVNSLFSHLGSGINLDEFLVEFPAVTREQAIHVLVAAHQSLIADVKDGNVVKEALA